MSRLSSSPLKNTAKHVQGLGAENRSIVRKWVQLVDGAGNSGASMKSRLPKMSSQTKIASMRVPRRSTPLAHGPNGAACVGKSRDCLSEIPQRSSGHRHPPPSDITTVSGLQQTTGFDGTLSLAAWIAPPQTPKIGRRTLPALTPASLEDSAEVVSCTYHMEPVDENEVDSGAQITTPGVSCDDIFLPQPAEESPAVPERFRRRARAIHCDVSSSSNDWRRSHIRSKEVTGRGSWSSHATCVSMQSGRGNRGSEAEVQSAMSNMATPKFDSLDNIVKQHEEAPRSPECETNVAASSNWTQGSVTEPFAMPNCLKSKCDHARHDSGRTERMAGINDRLFEAAGYGPVRNDIEDLAGAVGTDTGTTKAAGGGEFAGGESADGMDATGCTEASSSEAAIRIESTGGQPPSSTGEAAGGEATVIDEAAGGVVAGSKTLTARKQTTFSSGNEHNESSVSHQAAGDDSANGMDVAGCIVTTTSVAATRIGSAGGRPASNAEEATGGEATGGVLAVRENDAGGKLTTLCKGHEDSESSGSSQAAGGKYADGPQAAGGEAACGRYQGEQSRAEVAEVMKACRIITGEQEAQGGDSKRGDIGGIVAANVYSGEVMEGQMAAGEDAGGRDDAGARIDLEATADRYLAPGSTAAESKGRPVEAGLRSAEQDDPPGNVIPEGSVAGGSEAAEILDAVEATSAQRHVQTGLCDDRVGAAVGELCKARSGGGASEGIEARRGRLIGGRDGGEFDADASMMDDDLSIAGSETIKDVAAAEASDVILVLANPVYSPCKISKTMNALEPMTSRAAVGRLHADAHARSDSMDAMASKKTSGAERGSTEPNHSLHEMRSDDGSASGTTGKDAAVHKQIGIVVMFVCVVLLLMQGVTHVTQYFQLDWWTEVFVQFVLISALVNTFIWLTDPSLAEEVK